MRTGSRIKKYSFSKRFFSADKKDGISGNIIYFIAPAVILMLFLILFAAKHISPFGEYVYLPSDMYHQYCPFLSDLWYKLHDGGSLLYTHDFGLGTNFTALFAYYLSSPLNFFVVFFPHHMIPALMNAFIIIKMMAASVFFTIYISSHYKDKNILICAFSVFYAMSGYIAAFAWNIMWLDCVAVFPLVILGIERIIYKKKPVLFITALGLSVIFNYYISIMVVIGSVIYIICLLFIMDRSGERFAVIKRIFMFLWSSAIAAGLAAVLLLPEIYAFKLSASSASTFPTTLKAYQSFLQIISRQMTFSPSYTWLEHYPNIYAGVILVALIPLFFMLPKIPVRQKIIKGVIIGIFIFSFMFNIPEYIWHGFHFPNCLPARQSFIYIFFILTCGYEVIKNRRSIRFYHWLISLEISAAYLIIMFIAFRGDTTVADDKAFTYSIQTLMWNAVFLAIYYFLLLFIINPKRYNVYFISIASICVLFTEAAVHMGQTGLSLVNYTEYKKNDDKYELLKKSLDNSGFYRMDQYEARTANDGAWYGYKSANTFSSTSPRGVSDFYKAMGTKAAMNSYQRLGSTEMMESLLSIRYTIEKKAYAETADPVKKLVFEDDDLFVYENPYTLSLGYAIPSSVAGSEPEKGATVRDAIDYQNILFEDLTGINGLFHYEAKYDSEKKVTHNVSKSGHLYISVYGSVPEKMMFAVNEAEGTEVKGLNTHNRLVDMGYVSEGDKIDISSEDDFKLKCYIMDTELLKEGYEKLAASDLEIKVFEDTFISGSYNAENDGSYLFTLPYDGGWSVYVDGQEVQTSPALGAFLSIQTTKGSHNVELKYFPKGLKAGIIISLASLGILIILIVTGKKRNDWEVIS